jgi:hypothetical protein
MEKQLTEKRTFAITPEIALLYPCLVLGACLREQVLNWSIERMTAAGGIIDPNDIKKHLTNLLIDALMTLGEKPLQELVDRGYELLRSDLVSIGRKYSNVQ